MTHKVFASMLLLIATLAISVPIAQAQLEPPPPTKYKVGDRVEFDMLETGDSARAKWVKATVTKINIVKLSSTLSQTTYQVTVDPLPGQLPKVYDVSQRLAEQGMSYAGDPSRATGFVRPLGGGRAGPKIESDKLRVDENGTVLADRELLDCKNLKAGPARNGTSPPTELAKKLIRCLFEAPSSPGQDGATKVDISEFVAGPAHRWNRNVDVGMDANISTMVYPFRVRFDQKTFYRQHNEAYTGVERIFTCFVQVDQWYCGQAQRLKDGDKTLIPVVP